MIKVESIRSLAERSGLSYDKIAVKLGVTGATLYNWCRVGKQKDPSYRKYMELKALADGEEIKFEENKK